MRDDLSVIGQPGDLADEPVGWQLGGRRAGERNRVVLTRVRDRARSTVAVGLAHKLGRATADELCGVKPGPRQRAVTKSGDSALLQLFVPASKTRAPVIQVELTGTRKPLKLTTYVRPGTAPLVVRRTRHAAALTALKKAGLSEERNGWYAVRDGIEPSADAVEPETALWARLEPRLQAIIDSGTLDSYCS